MAYSVDKTEDHPEEFVVEASPRGIEIKGKLLLTSPQVDLHALAKVIGKAGHDHVALRPKIEIAREVPV